MTTNITTAEAYNAVAECTMKEVRRLLKWDELRLAEFRYIMGVEYLRIFEPVNAKNRAILERSKLFWGWWKTVCNENDYCFINVYDIAALDVVERLHLYNGLHCPRALAAERKPNEVVLQELKKQRV